MSTNLILSEIREKIMDTDEDISLISENERIFRATFSSISPISFEQFSYNKENKRQAEMIRKAFEYYLSRIEYIRNVKDDIKNNKFTTKNLFKAIGKSEKTIYNQKGKFTLFFDYIDVLNTKYQIEASLILKAYLKPNKNNIVLETADKVSTSELTRRLLQLERENKKLKSALEEIKYITDEVDSIDEFKDKTNKIYKKVEAINNGNL